MENEFEYILRSANRYTGYDVEVFDHQGRVWLALDPNSRNDERAARDLTPSQARELAAALLRFADQAEV